MSQENHLRKRQFFKKYSLDRFSVKRNLDFLLRAEPQFQGQKEIITKGLSVYLLLGSKKIAQRAMKIEIMNQIIKSENSYKKASLRRDFFSDFMGRMNYLEPSFFEEAYYPIGGMKALSRAGSLKELKKEILPFRYEIAKFINLMRVYHFWHQNLRDDAMYSRPSLNNCIPMLNPARSIKSGKAKASSKQREKLGKYVSRAAILYASSTIKIEGDKTILDKMKDNSLTYKIFEPAIELCIARARYFSFEVLREVPEIFRQKDSSKPKLHEINLKKLPIVDPVAFECTPSFSNEEKERLRLLYIATPPGPKPRTS